MFLRGDTARRNKMLVTFRGKKKVNTNRIVISVYTWKGWTLRVRLIAINNSHVVVRIEIFQ